MKPISGYTAILIALSALAAAMPPGAAAGAPTAVETVVKASADDAG